MWEVLVSVDKVHSWRKSKGEDSSGYGANAIVRSSRTFTYRGYIDRLALTTFVSIDYRSCFFQ